MSAAYLITAGLGVPAMTFIGLWLLRLLRQRRQALEPDSFLAEAELAELAAGISTGEEQVRKQLAGLYHGWRDRDVHPGADAGRERAGQAPERLGILLDAAALVAATGDRQELLQRITEFVVPGLADFCIVFLPAGEERLRAAAFSNRHRGCAAAFARVREQSVAAAGPVAAGVAHRTGTVQLVADVTVEAARWAESEPALAEVLTRPPARSVLAVPLTAVTQRLGVMVLGRDAGRAPFADRDIGMAGELSRRLAAALAHADAFTRDRAVAETLARSLLPETLPAVAGLDLAVRYLPASDGAAVGGDWYDAFPLDAHRVGLVVGDVVGHSITSACVMGQVRTLLRTCALDVSGPGEVLRRANQALARLLPEAMATVACVVLDPATGDLTYATAGHPPPLITTATATRYLDSAPGIMLGTGTDAPFTAGTSRLPPASGLLLYTDGLIEDRRRDIGAGMHALAGALRQSAPRTAEQICTTAHQAMLGTAPLADDICLLAAWRGNRSLPAKGQRALATFGNYLSRATASREAAVKAQKTRRRGLRVSHAWIIWYAVVLHTVWGCLLLLSPAVYGVTAMHVFHELPRGVMAGALFSASGLAVWAVTWRQPSLKSLAALLPQQALLTLSALAATAAVFVAHYGDGAPRPRLFILADQAPAIIAFVLHTAAVIEMHARRTDGELLRIIRLFRERGPAEVQGDLRAG